jgi:dTDP-alpha-D-glucose dehydrogenase
MSGMQGTPVRPGASPGGGPPSSPSVAVIGLGYVGCCLAATLADRNLDVVGVDIDAQLIGGLARGHPRFEEPGLREMVQRTLRTGRLRVTADYAATSAADVVVIAVGTPVDAGGSLADGQLRGACASLRDHIRKGQLVLLKSTVPPGTTRNLVAPLLEGGGLRAGADFRLAFTPERLAESTALGELLTIPIVVGGIDERSTREAAQFWRQALGVTVIPQDSAEAAEIVKLADNWWIDLNIALGNELARFCALYGADVLDVIAAANTVPKGNGNVNILLPSVGVGGSCLTKDPWMVWRAARNHDLEIRTARVGREVNDSMPAYTVRLIIEELKALGKDPAAATVAVLGVAFKNNTADMRATPVRDAIKALTEEGVWVRVHDPLVDTAQAEKILGIRPCGTVREAVRDADCLAILAMHKEFESIDFGTLPVADSCVILDGRAYLPKQTITRLRELGFRYRGIGR